MLRRTPFTSSAADERQRIFLLLFLLISTLFSGMWLALPDGTGHAQNYHTQSEVGRAESDSLSNPSSLCDFLQRQSRRVVLNLSRIDNPVTQNHGQFDPSVRFASIGLAGNTVYFKNNGVISLSLGAVYGKPAVRTDILYLNSSPRAQIKAGEPLTSTTSYISDDRLGQALSNLKNFGGVRIEELYKGISASHTSSSRQLKTQYIVQPGADLGQIRLRIPTAQSLRVDDATGNLLVELSASSSSRIVKLHPAKLSQGGEVKYIRYRVERMNIVSLNLAEGFIRADRPLLIESRITFASDFHEYDAVQDKNGFVFAASTAFNTRQRGPSGSGSDVILARLNPGGEQILSTTIIAGSADDTASSIAASLNGGIYVAGSTASRDFPIKRPSRARPESMKAFVGKFDDTISKLLNGIYLDEKAVTSAHDVAITEQGSVLVAGTTDGGFTNVNKADFSFKTIFPVDSESRAQGYFLTELDANLATKNHGVSFNGPRLVSPLTLWIDCDRGINLGVLALATGCGVNSSAWSSQMSDWSCSISNFYVTDVTNSTKTWGRHPISWKRCKAVSTYNFNSGSYYSVSTQGLIPNGAIYAPDGPKLDQIEAGGTFVLVSGGQVSDPPGVWNVNRYDNNGSGQNPQNVLELALGAAFYHLCCGSPVYAGFLEFPCTNCIPYYDPMVIRQVNLCINDDSSGPRTLQQALGPTWFSDPGGGDTHDFPYLAAAQMQLTFDSFDGAIWRGSGFYVFNGLRLSSPMPLQLSGLGWYIADPPESQRFLANNIEEATGQLRNSIYAGTQLKSTLYRAGKPASVETITGQIRMRDFPFHPIKKTRSIF